MKKFIFIPIGLILLGFGLFFGIKGYSDASFGVADINKGKSLYQANCLACHGEKGLGKGVVAQTMEVKPDSIYEELVNPFGFKAELINSVLTGDNGQGGLMPPFKDILSEKDVNDIFGYIISINEKK